jgi:eukaryotic-like serine/threonine-protein kinase
VSDVITTAQRWQRVKSILADAMERPSPEERTAYLERSCGGDTTLIREVEELLALSAENLEELADNTPVAFRRPAPAQPIGRRIGAYEIVRELGRGGMGAVYLAKRADGQFEKEVAIKLLKRGTDTDEILRRFQAERRILARLDHPNIARLLDAGTTDDGLPYFVMEYIEGAPITDYVRGAQLSVAKRLQLFLKVCEAAQFAHQQRVVHRDLKPGNIFVRQDGEPKLLDFGIAKLLASGDDSIELTLTAERRFTPVCASPEQARGEAVTPASDVYALGALLYEILTDRPPHRFSTPHPSPAEVAQVIGEQEPTRPSLTVAKGDGSSKLLATASPSRGGQAPSSKELRGDLDNIVLTALRKEPARRYSSVAEFAEDVRRHIQGRAIRARPNTLAYVSRRFVGRQKYRILAGVMVAALGTALGVVLFSYRAELKRRPSFSNSQASPATADKSIAVLPFRNLSNDTANAFFADGMQDQILTDLAQIADLKVVSRTSVMQYRDPARNLKEIGEALQVAYVLEGAVQRNGSRIHMNAQLVDTRTNARVWAENYDRDVADVFAMQTEVAEKIVTQLKVNLSPREKVAIAERTTNDVEAYDWYLRAKSWAEQPRVGKEGELEAEGFLDKAIQRDPNFARAYCLLSAVELVLYRYFDHSPARQVKAENAVRTAVRLRPDLGQVRLAEAGYYYRTRDFEKARSALTVASRVLPNNSDVLVWSASIDKRQGRWKESLNQLERALEVDPRNPEILHDLINIYQELRRYSDSERLVEKGLAEFPEAKLAFLDDKFSVAYAIGDTKTCREIIESLPRGYNPGGHTSMIRFQVAFLDRDWEEAERIIDAAKKLAPEGFITPIPFLYGFMARAQGDQEKARPLFIQSRKILEQTLNKRPDDAEPLIWIGLTDAALGRKEEAIREGREAVAKEPISRDASTGAYFETFLAQIYAWAGEKDLAIEQLAKVVKLPNGPTVGSLKLSADWDDVRGDPRFAPIVEESARPIDLASLEDKKAMAPAIPEKSIAVLPFENLSDDKANSFFADGVQDEILTDLTKVADLKVISRTSVMQYKNVIVRNLRDIARELGVTHVLEGSVQRVGNRIRVSAQLIDARTDAHLWAEHYDRDASDVFAIQNEIAQSIAGQLQAKISPNEKAALEQKPTTNLVAYDLYLRAKALLDEISISIDWEGDNRRAIDLLDRAVTQDPNFALAYCLLYNWNFNLYDWVDHTPTRLARARAALEQAIRIAPEAAETYLARSNEYKRNGDLDRASELLEQASKALPGNSPGVSIACPA